MSLFDNLSGDEDQLLAHLETQLPMLSDSDQDFVIGCRLHIEAGTRLTPQNIAVLHRIAATLGNTAHSALEGTLSVQKMLKDLATNHHILSYEEKKFLNKVAQTHQNSGRLGEYEVELLVKLYGSKGF